MGHVREIAQSSLGVPDDASRERRPCIRPRSGVEGLEAQPRGLQRKGDAHRSRIVPLASVYGRRLSVLGERSEKNSFADAFLAESVAFTSRNSESDSKAGRAYWKAPSQAAP